MSLYAYEKFAEGSVEHNFNERPQPDTTPPMTAQEREILGRERHNAYAKCHPFGWHYDELVPHFSPVSSSAYSNPVIQPDFVETFFNSPTHNFAGNFINLAVFLDLDVSVAKFAKAVQNHHACQACCGGSDVTMLYDLLGKPFIAEQMRWYNLARSCYHYIDDVAFKIFKLCNKHLSTQTDWTKSPFYGLKVWQIRNMLKDLDTDIQDIQSMVGAKRLIKPRNKP